MTAASATRPLLAQARDAMPTLAAADRALAVVKAAAADLHAKVRIDSDVIDDAVDNLLAGNSVPDDIGARLFDVRRHNETLQLQHDGLAKVEGRLRERLRSSQTRDADHGLKVLAASLEELLVEARPAVEATRGIDSADAALTAGRGEEWLTVRRLAARHAELREAQAALVGAALFPSDRGTSTVVPREARRLVSGHGTVRDFDELFPAGLPGLEAAQPVGGGARIVNGRLVTTAVTSEAVDAPPWLAGDAISALRYMAAPDSKPWVPMIGELTAARDAADARRAGPRPEPVSLEVSPQRARQVDRQAEQALASYDPRGRTTGYPSIEE